MTEQEYKQKRRECFVKFCKDNGIDQEVNISIFDAFDQIFDRAYALGKETKTITQEEIEKAAEEYALSIGDSCFSEQDIANAFYAGAEYAMLNKATTANHWRDPKVELPIKEESC